MYAEEMIMLLQPSHQRTFVVCALKNILYSGIGVQIAVPPLYKGLNI